MKRKHKTTKSAGDAYERYVARKMRRRGFIFVKVSGKSGDFGADVLARDLLLRKVVVQCKHYSGRVGVEAVQEIYAAKKFYNARRAIVATNSKFTSAARRLAHRTNVELWECY